LVSPTQASTPSLNFEEDCANGVLPDVSFLGTGGDEHPPDLPAQGAQYLASKLEALAANEDPVTFPNLSRWRRATFSEFTGALRPGALRPAPLCETPSAGV
jgi:Phosphoesterase family